MDSDFSEKLKTVLSDPDALAKISGIASSLGMGSPSPPAEPLETDVRPEPSEPSALQGFSAFQGDSRLALLNSIKPLLREEKRPRIDALVRAVSIASMIKNFRK